MGYDGAITFSCSLYGGLLAFAIIIPATNQIVYRFKVSLFFLHFFGERIAPAVVDRAASFNIFGPFPDKKFAVGIFQIG